jgi:hypothetical protein
MPTFILAVVLLTLVMATVAQYAIASINTSGLLPTDFKAADVITERCPLHLVRPRWVAGKDQADVLLNWPIAEAKARLLLLFVAWLLGVGVLVRLSARNQRHENLA